ncbi:hypothetical protein [Bacillus thuringiensis]|nr:hypothetical protein [Bacillus thuringiensis]
MNKKIKKKSKQNTNNHGRKKRRWEERECAEIRYRFEDYASSSGNDTN